MADSTPDNEPALVERWLQDQRQWQRTILSYVDSMIKNDDFLVHLGNAMRGSLLAGKPYPTAAAPGPAPSAESPADDRLDRVLFAIAQLQGQLHDVMMTLDEIRLGETRTSPVETPATSSATSPTRPRVKPAPVSTAAPVRRRKTSKRRARG